MKIIDGRTVELNDTELGIKERFEVLLDEGLGIPQAALQAIEEWHSTKRINARLNALFVCWLSEGYVRPDHWARHGVTISQRPSPAYAHHFLT